MDRIEERVAQLPHPVRIAQSTRWRLEEIRTGVATDYLPLIRRLNADIDTGVNYDLREDGREFSICSTTRIGLHGLTQHALLEVLDELASRMSAMDRSLVKNGYAA